MKCKFKHHTKGVASLGRKFHGKKIPFLIILICLVGYKNIVHETTWKVNLKLSGFPIYENGCILILIRELGKEDVIFLQFWNGDVVSSYNMDYNHADETNTKGQQ